MARNVVMTLLFIGLIAGVVVWSLQGVESVECEVCITFEGETVCRTGQGRDRSAAVNTAQTAACAVLAIGRAQTIKCGNLQPTSVSCN